MWCACDVFLIHNRQPTATEQTAYFPSLGILSVCVRAPTSVAIILCCFLAGFQQNRWATPKTGLSQCGFTHCCLELETFHGTVCLSFDQSGFWINRYEMAIRLTHSRALCWLFPELTSLFLTKGSRKPQDDLSVICTMLAYNTIPWASPTGIFGWSLLGTLQTVAW